MEKNCSIGELKHGACKFRGCSIPKGRASGEPSGARWSGAATADPASRVPAATGSGVAVSISMASEGEAQAGRSCSFFSLFFLPFDDSTK